MFAARMWDLVEYDNPGCSGFVGGVVDDNFVPAGLDLLRLSGIDVVFVRALGALRRRQGLNDIRSGRAVGYGDSVRLGLRGLLRLLGDLRFLVEPEALDGFFALGRAVIVEMEWLEQGPARMAHDKSLH